MSNKRMFPPFIQTILFVPVISIRNNQKIIFVCFIRCCGSGSGRIHIIKVTLICIRIRIKILKLDPERNPDAHQFAAVKPKCMEYEHFFKDLSIFLKLGSEPRYVSG
jgi:hypothetical protein